MSARVPWRARARAAALGMLIASVNPHADAAGEFEAGLAAYDAGDPARALALWLPLAEAGDADAQNNVGWLFENGESVARDLERALFWYRQAAEQDPRWNANVDRVRAATTTVTPPAAPAASASFEAGLAAYDAGDAARAARIWRPLAETGDADAQNNLGWLYENGEGVPRDLEEALRWYRSASTVNPQWGTNRDRVAVALAAARQQAPRARPGAPAAADADGRFAEAMRLFQARQDLQAAALFEPLARSGHALAQTNLGYLYETGRGVGRDERRARDLYLEAARQGEPYAQNNLAVLLASGRGGEVDLVGAYVWFDMAARGGHPQAGQHLGTLDPMLSTGERTEAARLARAQRAAQSRP